MNEDEAKLVGVCFSEADSGCTHCVNLCLDAFKNYFPDLYETAKEAAYKQAGIIK